MAEVRGLVVGMASPRLHMAGVGGVMEVAQAVGSSFMCYAVTVPPEL